MAVDVEQQDCGTWPVFISDTKAVPRRSVFRGQRACRSIFLRTFWDNGFDLRLARDSYPMEKMKRENPSLLPYMCLSRILAGSLRGLTGFAGTRSSHGVQDNS